MLAFGMATPAPPAFLELLKPITWFPPMWAFGCGVVSSGLSLAGQWPVIVAGDHARRAARLRHQPGGERLVRPPRRRHQRAAPADPVGPHARAAGASTSPSSGPRCRSASRPRSGRGCFGAAVVGLVARLGLQRAAVPAEAERLVGQRRRRRSATRACPGSPAPRSWLGALPDWRILVARRALQHRRARHHDAQRLQVGRRRPAHGHRARCRCSSASDAAARLACVVMAVPQVVVDRAAARAGAARCTPPASPRCSPCQLVLMRRLLAQPREKARLVQRHRHHALRARHAGHRLRAAPDHAGPDMSARSAARLARHRPARPRADGARRDRRAARPRRSTA